MIDFRLKVFCSVARNLSFTKASKELFISQPAISKHIQELEAEYKIRLFERKGTHIESDTVGLNIKNIVNESDTVTFLYAEDNPFPGESLV